MDFRHSTCCKEGAKPPRTRSDAAISHGNARRRWTSGGPAPEMEIPDPAMEKLKTYVACLLDWNQRMNLTGAATPAAVWNQLVLDSLMAAHLLPDAGHALDLGSGAGIPAIPIKILSSGLRIHLVEANQRKCTFLRHVVREIGLTAIEIFPKRLEDLPAPLHPSGYDAATARAAAPIDQVLRWAAPHLKDGGRLINFQGARPRPAVEQALSHRQCALWSLQGIYPYRLPDSNAKRHLVVFRKNRPEKAPAKGKDAKARLRNQGLGKK
jgi:16S rRNA (guanine527-N7)-methyltransferase